MKKLANVFTAFSTIRAKIISMSVSLIAMAIIAVGIGIINMQKISHEMNNIVNYDIPFNDGLGVIRVHQLEQTLFYEQALRHAIAAKTNPAAMNDFRTASNGFAELTNKVKQDMKEVNTIIETVLTSETDPAYVQEFTKLKERFEVTVKEYAEFKKHAQISLDKIVAGDLQGGLAMEHGVIEKEHKTDVHLAELVHEVEAFVKHSTDAIAKEKELAIAEMIIIAIAVFILGGIMSYLIIRSLCNRLKIAVSNAIMIADGDLTTEIDMSGTDEVSVLMAAMGTMQSNLKKLIGAINDSSAALASSSQEMSVASEQTNQSVHEQKAEIEQIATAITEMAATVQEVAKNTADTSQATAEANDKTRHGNSLVKQTIDAINALNDEICQASDVITELNTETENITSVLDVIKGVAEQTNLLALNAAIEAARAGEQGRGFAVVADEVRTLAQRTQESTSDIESMIETLQAGASKAVNAMSVSQSQAASSVEYAGKTGESLNDITESINNISDMNAQIASAAEEQSAVADEVNKNIHSITENVEMVASSSTEITASAENLAETANRLHLDVQAFKIA